MFALFSFCEAREPQFGSTVQPFRSSSHTAVGL
jgi:hypothetical protein